MAFDHRPQSLGSVRGGRFLPKSGSKRKDTGTRNVVWVAGQDIDLLPGDLNSDYSLLDPNFLGFWRHRQGISPWLLLL